MLPHSTVAGTHFVAAVVVACMFPAAVGIVVVGVAVLAPSGTWCLLAVVVVVVAAAFVDAIAAAVAVVATVAAVVTRRSSDRHRNSMAYWLLWVEFDR